MQSDPIGLIALVDELSAQTAAMYSRLGEVDVSEPNQAKALNLLAQAKTKIDAAHRIIEEGT